MRTRVAGTTSLLELVLAGLDGAEVRWALLRGRASLGVSGRDVDLLIAGDDMDTVEDVVFGMGGLALPRSTHPWHRFYILEDPESGERVALDVVNELIYGRRLQIHSGLETTCLDRRRRDGAIHVLDPTDMFWTVLLHCVLDKQSVTERRRAELDGVVAKLSRPSRAEEFFEKVCPPGWSADRALESVAAHDWDALAGLGRQICSGPGGARVGRVDSIVAAPRRMLRTAARAIYPVVWRGAGLGVTPHILDVVEAASVDAIVVSLRRRPGLCEVVLLIADEQQHGLLSALKEHHYRRAIGGWNRATRVGLERVRTMSPSRLALSSPAWEDIRLCSSPMPGRAHCRRASAGAALLVTTIAVSRGQVRRGSAGQVGAGSTQAWAEAARLATTWCAVTARHSDRGQEGLMKVVRRIGESRPLRVKKPRRKPVTVSFSGLDGAGKTRQIDALVAAIGEHHSVEVLWLPTEVWPEPLLNRLPAGCRSRLGPKRRTVVSAPAVDRTGGEQVSPAETVATNQGRASFVDTLRSAVWVAIGTVASVSVGLSLRRRTSRSTADVLVLDRYRLDSMVKLQCWYAEVSAAWLARVVAALAPAPDVEILLRADPAVAYARKAEQWSLDQLSTQARLYDRLAAGPLHVVTLEANGGAADLAREVGSRVRAVLDGC